jgi:hypothetical protein
LANQFKIADILYPIFSDDPTSFLYPSHLHQMNRFHQNPSSYKPTKPTYRGYYGTSVAGTTALELLTNSNRIQSETTSAIIDHDTTITTNDTYGICNSHSTQQARASRHPHYDQPNQSATSSSDSNNTIAATDAISTTNAVATITTGSLNSASFDSTDYSTASSCSNLSDFPRDSYFNSRENEGCRIALS